MIPSETPPHVPKQTTEQKEIGRLTRFDRCVRTQPMSQDLDFSDRRNCVSFNLRRVARVVTHLFDAEMRRHGIRSTQGSILFALHATGKSNMAELSEILGVERTTLLRNLPSFNRDDLVT